MTARVPGHQWWRKVSRSRVPCNAVWAIGILAWALMIPTYWNAATGYLVGTSIAVIGLYIAFILPVILRFRQGDNFEHGAWSLGKHYKWIDIVSIIWVAIISILFLGPVTPTGIPWKDGFNWDVANYAPLTVGGALLSLRRLVADLRQELVQGPGADGHRGGAREDGGATGGGLRSPRRTQYEQPRRRHRTLCEGRRRAPSPRRLPHPGAAVLVDRLARDAARVR